uniref:NADH-ubiquinone oxidoreductase chain 3 n=1 Tax=Liposcelis bostrychophila TaxID=185214 RepID=A0A3Q8C377_LIPBO|nr:NADH dehydrogenase subunit 3 [Liposcelis bostrychophila]ATU74578.1 NADH dehydrogenase subunit 3 [Liposcelis bostrychophila]
MIFMFVLSLIFIVVLLIFFVHAFNSSSKIESFSDHPFECGISSNFSSRNSFSLPFFFLTLIFLMFDVEIILLFVLIFFNLSAMFVALYLLILLLLLASLFLEWNFGSLMWLKL